MKTPPPSAPPDSPALLYLLALCDPGGPKDHDNYHNQNNNNYHNMSPNDRYPFGSGKELTDMSIDEMIKELRKRLPGMMTRFHHFLLRANRLMSTPSGIDKVLMTVSYMLQVLTPNLPRGSLLISSFRSLTSLISDIRIFHRLWGLLGIYSWGHSLLQHPPRDLTIRRIVAAQVLANACFQVFENVAYLASHQVVRLGKKGQGRLWVWSSRFWMAHVGLEFWRLQRVRELRMQKVSRGLLGRGDEEEEERWKREVISNCAYAPLTLHWSVKNGMIGPSVVGALGSVAAVIGLQNAWQATA